VELPAVLASPIRTARLVLRPFAAEDRDPLYTFHSDPGAVRYVPYPPRTRDQVAEVLQRKIANTTLRQDGDLLELAVAVADDQP
jgi:RimJ/RimL family protein N-acetyltransferase